MENRPPPRPPALFSFVSGPLGCIFSFVVFICISVGMTWVVLYSLRQMAPRSWDVSVAGFFELGGVQTALGLSEESEGQVVAAGLSPENTRWAIEASNWISREHGVYVDPGIMLVINQHEGREADADGMTAATGNPHLRAADERAAIEFLLSHWREHGVTGDHIYPDYSGYTGHPSAGELPGGFIPTTAKYICERYLMPSGDPELEGCDFWNPRLQYFSTGIWLFVIGYDAKGSPAERVEQLYGWNQNHSYREDLVADADALESLSGLEWEWIMADAETVIAVADTYNIRVSDAFGVTPLTQPSKQRFVSFLSAIGLLSPNFNLASGDALAKLTGEVSEGDPFIRFAEVPADGQLTNFLTWVERNPVITVHPGTEWSFCGQTGDDWGSLQYAHGVNAGGICANATLVKLWADGVPGLEVVKAPKHDGSYHAFQVGISCPGADLRLKNTTDAPVTGQFVVKDDTVYMITVKGESPADVDIDALDETDQTE